ncbi:MAG TPA: amidohydrolase family protein [Chitinophagaceae bacterium]|jgi:L-fuconolactonase|nr:amidohydrolase family protein [Chitinophagaceae bacterium]
MIRVIDTHVHVWNLERAQYSWLEEDTSILNRTWRIEEIEAERKEAGIVAGVLVQAAGNLEDTELMLETAYNTEWIKGVVCWLPLTDPETTGQLLKKKYLKEKYFKGVRHQIHDERDPKWLLQLAVIKSLKLLEAHNIPYDVVAVLPAHIETALQVAEKVPNLRMVFDHLSQPPISTKEKFGRWGEMMKEATQHKNFYAKISGLGTASGNFQDRKVDDIKPYVEFALQHFGINRCFCGGDWPVSMLANSYFSTWQVIKQIVQELLSEDEQDKLFYSNAEKFYNLQLG